MSKNKMKSQKSKVERRKSIKPLVRVTFYFLLFALTFATACRYDMQDQPRYKAYKESDFFKNQMGSRPTVDGTVARGRLHEDKALFSGKKDGEVPAATEANPYPDVVDEYPVPVTKELVDRGEDRYKIFCIECHGPLGTGNGMIARRGYNGVASYHTDKLRNAPVGHFYDVVTNGWGKMSGYAAQIPVADRWAIVAYVRALQISQNPNPMTPVKSTATATSNSNTQVADKTQVTSMTKDGGMNK